jgi:hypothetical protein
MVAEGEAGIVVAVVAKAGTLPTNRPLFVTFDLPERMSSVQVVDDLSQRGEDALCAILHQL